MNEVISIPLHTLIESASFSSCIFSCAGDLAPDQRQWQWRGSGVDGHQDASLLSIFNAVKIALMLTRAFVQFYDNERSDNALLVSLQLDSFVVKLQYSQNNDNDIKEGEMPMAGDAPILPISSSIQFDAIISNRRVLIIDVDMKCSVERIESANINVENLMQSLGNLLYAIFTQNDVRAQDSNDENNHSVIETKHRFSKTRRNAKKSLFDQLIESGYPMSVCRLLSDLIDRCNTKHPFISFDDIIHDLEQMNSHPHTFLINPENEFFSSTIHFGQRFTGRSEELEKLFEVLTLPDVRNVGLQTIFVSGMSGSGKSHLISAVGSFASNLGFIVLKAKFKREMEYKSREILSTVMNKLVTNLVEMKESDKDEDIAYSCGATQAISNALDSDSLSSLVDFVPSLRALIPEIARKENFCCSHWQLVFLLSKLLRSVLSQKRKIFLALDDLQWCDPTTLALISEVLILVCQFKEESKRLVFVGMFRDDEVSNGLSTFTTSVAKLERDGSANLTDVKLSTISPDDVIEMIMSELRLPRRIVSELGDVVHKRTLGHAHFVVQLLNSLVSDSTIAYSPVNRRFYWDQDKVSNLKIADNVASLVISELKSMSSDELQCLRIISCFGIQVQYDLLEILEGFDLAPQGGFESHVCNLVNLGVIETIAGPSKTVIFSHDLIQEQVYEGIPEKERQRLHSDIGKSLSSMTSLDTRRKHEPIDAAIEQLYMNDGSDYEDSSVDASSLVSIATSQINNAGPVFFADPKQHLRFASWNLTAGNDAAQRSNFGAGLYYFKYGIAFLDEELWREDRYELCLKLHEGAVFASSALGEINQVPIYANSIINNVKFQDSLVAQHLLVGGLSASGKYKEAIARGLAVLRELKFDIPATPSPNGVMQMMKATEKEASVYNYTQIAHREVDTKCVKTKNIMKLVDAISVACYQVASPFLPLVACVTVRFSLQNSACVEAVSAFVLFAYFHIFLGQSFDESRHWVDVAKILLEKASVRGPVTRTQFMFFGFVHFWYCTVKESSDRLQETFELGLKVGYTESAYVAQCLSMKFRFLGGERLSSLSHAYDTHLKSVVRFSLGSAKLSVLDKAMIDTLTGNKTSNPFAIFNGMINNEESMLADSQFKMNFHIAEAVHLQKFTVAFWMGDYDEAAKVSDVAMSFPSAKMPKHALVYHIFFKGIIAFHQYREGKGEFFLDEGNTMQEQVETWAKNSKPFFENKLILLEAEHYASMCNVVAARESYELSIKVARDNGYIHEQGLAYECMGKYLVSIVEVHEAKRCFMSAHKCYKQWGADAKADKLWKDWNLTSSIECMESCAIKHKRDE